MLLALGATTAAPARARAAECDASAGQPADAASAAEPADDSGPPGEPGETGSPSDDARAPTEAAGLTEATASDALPDGTAAAPDPVDADVPDSAAEALGRTPRRVKCLDESMVDEFGRTAVRKGVQPRDFRKALRVAIGIGGGARAGDLVDTQWQVGANLAFWPFEELGFDVDFKLSPTTLRVERSATAFTGEDRYPDGVVANLSYAVLGHVLFAPFHTKLRARGDRIIHGDFMLIAGGGAVIHSTVQAAAFDLGAGFQLFPAKFVSIRFDVVDRIMAQEALGSRRIANDILVSLGVSLWIPPRRR